MLSAPGVSSAENGAIRGQKEEVWELRPADYRGHQSLPRNLERCCNVPGFDLGGASGSHGQRMTGICQAKWLHGEVMSDGPTRSAKRGTTCQLPV